MNKKFISVLCAVSCVSSLFVAAQAKTTDIIDNNSTTGFAPNITDEKNGTLQQNGNTLRYECDCGWNMNHGIKKDISAELKNNGFKKGDKLSVSLNVTSAWYDNPAIAVVKVDDQTIKLGEVNPGGTDWQTAELTGSAEVSFDIPESYKAEFIVTQPCGTVEYANIKLTLDQADAPVAPSENPTENPSENPSDKPVDPSTDDFKLVLSTKGMTEAGLSALLGMESHEKLVTYYWGDGDGGYSDPYIENNHDGSYSFKGISNWNLNNGFKIDITKFVQLNSKIKVVFDFKSSEPTAERKMKAWFIAGSDRATRTETNIYEGKETDNRGEYTTYTSNEVTVSSEADKYYLAFSDNASHFWVRRIQIYVAGGTGDVYVDPTKPTAEPTAEPTATPTVEPTAEPTATPTPEPTATPEPTPTPIPDPTFNYVQGSFEANINNGEWFAEGKLAGSLEGAELTDGGKLLKKGDEVVTVWVCDYTGVAENGLDVSIFENEDSSKSAAIPTNITGYTTVRFYILTNRAAVHNITAKAKTVVID